MVHFTALQAAVEPSRIESGPLRVPRDDNAERRRQGRRTGRREEGNGKATGSDSTEASQQEGSRQPEGAGRQERAATRNAPCPGWPGSGPAPGTGSDSTRPRGQLGAKISAFNADTRHRQLKISQAAPPSLRGLLGSSRGPSTPIGATQGSSARRARRAPVEECEQRLGTKRARRASARTHGMG